MDGAMTDTRYIGRFAPSPTGPLHRGSLIAALASWLDARAAGGEWRLRIDDVDRGRARVSAARDIRAALEVLGLEWDGPVQVQDARRDHYQAALERLQASGDAYPCACTRREVAAGGEAGPAGIIYPETCRDGLPAGREARSWRFRVPDGPLGFEDRRLGPQSLVPAAVIGDFVIRRGDGLHAYHLAMVVDDAALGVTDVVRGADLLPATPPQMLLRSALGLPQPRHLHVPVATDPQGRKLSKTNAAPPVDTRRAGAAVADALAFLGHPPPADLADAPPAMLLEWAVGHWQSGAIARDDLASGLQHPQYRVHKV